MNERVIVNCVCTGKEVQMEDNTPLHKARAGTHYYDCPECKQRIIIWGLYIIKED